MSSYVSSALVLLYHRVADLQSDPQLLSVTPKHFAEHLEVLGSKAQPLALEKLANTFIEGRIPNRGVVVTFDDGYSDNLRFAKPILEYYDMPATVFISAGEIGSKREFWWDELERLILQPGIMPESLTLNIQGEALKWKIGMDAEVHEQECPQNRAWTVIDKTDPSLRQRVYRDLHERLRTLPSREQQNVLNDLSKLTGAQPTNRRDYLPLNPDEIIDMVEGGLIEVGAHTVTHPILSTLSCSEQQIEIKQSKSQLEKIAGRHVTSFAYPFGAKTDYTSETIGLVREAGFTCACSNFPEVVWKGADPFQLPRILVRDMDGDAFACLLRKYWGD